MLILSCVFITTQLSIGDTYYINYQLVEHHSTGEDSKAGQFKETQKEEQGRLQVSFLADRGLEAGVKLQEAIWKVYIIDPKYRYLHNIYVRMYVQY